MSNYRLSIPRRVGKSMQRFLLEVYDRVDAAILHLAENPRPPGCKSLKGREEWRVRVGDYRVVYAIDGDQRLVEILSVAHRRDVYRRG